MRETGRKELTEADLGKEKKVLGGMKKWKKIKKNVGMKGSKGQRERKIRKEQGENKEMNKGKIVTRERVR